jgi:Mrp family chromosome partitioning ATPase
MQDFIAEASEKYDQVIFDSPPVLLVSDALVLASLVDGVILVVRAHQSSRGVVNRARELLERVNARLFGATLNAAQSRRGGYFREQFRTFYDYQAEASELGSDKKKSLPAAATDAEPSAPVDADDAETDPDDDRRGG